MAALSDYLEDKVLSWVKGSDMPTAPAAVYVGLFSDDPVDDASGTEETTNIRAAGRVAATFAAVANDGGGGKKIVSDADVDFGAADNVGDIVITHFGLFDAASAGNLLYHGALSADKTVSENDTIKFLTGSLTLILA